MEIKVPINTILEECASCPYFYLEMDSLSAFNRPDITIYKCQHINICEKAIELYKKHLEKEKESA